MKNLKTFLAICTVAIMIASCDKENETCPHENAIVCQMGTPVPAPTPIVLQDTNSAFIRLNIQTYNSHKNSNN